jgi:hypothetical protein
MRFSIKSILIIVAVVALWFTSFGVEDRLGDDIRRAILLAAFVLMCVKAILSRGRERVFWLTFSVVWAILGFGPAQQMIEVYVPDFEGMQVLAVRVNRSLDVDQLAIYWTFRILASLPIAAATGYFAALIYDEAQT